MTRRPVLRTLLLVLLGTATATVTVTASDTGAASAGPVHATNAPSGVAAPHANLPGWRLVAVDDFTGTRLNPRWFPYGGQPGGDPGGRWSSKHLVVRGGALRIQGYRDARYGGKFTTGGLSSHALAQTYGKWLVRFRVDAGQGIAYVALLWPEKGGWPPEIDFAEDNGVAARRTTTATLHYRTAATNNRTRSAARAARLTGWHTMGVEWRRGRITYTLDGRAWATMTGSAVPSVPMRLALQTQAWYCGGTWERCPDRTTPRRVDMDVDWVAVYRPA